MTELRAGGGGGKEGLSGHSAAQEARGLEEGEVEVEVEGGAEEELYELQQQCCCGGALGNMGPPQECGNPLLPLCFLTFSKTNSLLLQTAANDAKLRIM